MKRERSRAMSLPDQVISRAERLSRQEDQPSDTRLYLSTGCTLLNLAISDDARKGWPCGKIVNPIGDSDTGKTILAMTAMAEAAKSPFFLGHKLIYADIEEAIAFDVSEMFGEKLAKRLKLLSSQGDEPAPETVEELHYTLLDLIDSKEKFVFVVDSLDFLPSRDELEKTEEQRQAWKKGKETTGTFAMSKQKYLYKMLRELKGKISGTDSLLMIISHAHDKIGGFFPEKVRSGGKALLYASSYDNWLSISDSDKVRGRVIGRKIRSKATKNRITGKKRTVDFWIYDGLGIDNVKSNIDFLVSEKVWDKGGGGYIDTKDFGHKGQIKDLAKSIDSDHKSRTKLAEKVWEVWHDIEKSISVDREPRYR